MLRFSLKKFPAAATTQAGGYLFSKSYKIALPKTSPRKPKKSKDMAKFRILRPVDKKRDKKKPILGLGMGCYKMPEFGLYRPVDKKTKAAPTFGLARPGIPKIFRKIAIGLSPA